MADYIPEPDAEFQTSQDKFVAHACANANLAALRIKPRFRVRTSAG